MYHYFMYKKREFCCYIGVFLTFLFISNSYIYSMKSPRERWNYNKSEDTIEHHQRNVKINENRYKLNKIKNLKYKDNKKDKKHRPGSPRDRW